MSARTRSFFSSFGRTITGFGESIAAARAMNDLYHTPDSAFRARGTTRDAELRAMMSRR